MIKERRDVSEALKASLEEKVPGAVLELLRSRGEPYLCVKPGSLLEVCRHLRDDPQWGFDFLALVSAVDWMGESPRFEVVYHLRSLSNNLRIGLKAAVPDDTLRVPSVYSLWKTADWLEREVYDLFGIHFSDHPNLKRIMMPDDWEGHPYRKDFPLAGRGQQER